MKRILWLAALLLIVGYTTATALVSVEESQWVVITRFGKPVRSIPAAGLTYKWPDPVETAIKLDKRQQLLALDPAEFVTRDRRNLVVSAFVLWRLAEPEKFLASVRNQATAELRLQTLANSEIGAAVGGRPLTDIFSVDEEQDAMAQVFAGITRATRDIARRELGIEIIAVRPNRFGFPQQNLLAIYKRMESERDRTARQYRAEGQEEAAKIRAETEREVRQLQAQASREAQSTMGAGDAQAAAIYARAHAANPEYYQFVRSLEAYEKILGSNTRLILSADSPLFKRLLTPPADPVLQNMLAEEGSP